MASFERGISIRIFWDMRLDYIIVLFFSLISLSASAQSILIDDDIADKELQIERCLQRMDVDYSTKYDARQFGLPAPDSLNLRNQYGNEVIACNYTAFDPADSGKGWYEKPATLYAMSKNTDHPKEAALLLDFMLNSKEWALLQGVEKGIPISHSALDYLEEAGMLTGLQYEASEVMANNINLREMDPRLELTDVIDAYIDACNLVLYDKATSDEAAAQFMTVCNESF